MRPSLFARGSMSISWNWNEAERATPGRSVARLTLPSWLTVAYSLTFEYSSHPPSAGEATPRRILPAVCSVPWSPGPVKNPTADRPPRPSHQEEQEPAHHHAAPEGLLKR